jgi:hypothetical protein
MIYADVIVRPDRLTKSPSVLCTIEPFTYRNKIVGDLSAKDHNITIIFQKVEKIILPNKILKSDSKAFTYKHSHELG